MSGQGSSLQPQDQSVHTDNTVSSARGSGSATEVVSNANGTPPTTPRGSVPQIITPSVSQILPRIPEVSINAQLPSVFDGTGSWRLWKAKLALFFKLRNIQRGDPQRHSVLLSLLSEAILDDVFGEFGEAAIDATPYDKVIEYLDKIYGQSKNLTSNRHDFHQMSERDEGPLKFLRDLKNKALVCDFRNITDFSDFSITMVYLTGVKDVNLRYLLLKEPKLTAAKAEEITRQHLATSEALGNLGKQQNVVAAKASEVHFVQKKSRNPKHGQKPRDDRCRNCGELGHYAKNCVKRQQDQVRDQRRSQGVRRSRGQAYDQGRSQSRHNQRTPHRRSNRRHKVNEVNEDSDPDDTYALHAIGINDKEPPCMVQVMINQIPIQMELDTGAQISIIGESDYQKLGRPQIVESVGKVTSYGTNVPMIGKIAARCRLGDHGTEVKIAVAKGLHKVSLLGRDLLRLLKVDMGPYFNSTRVVHSVAESPEATNLEIHEKNPEVRQELMEILKENAEVFSPGKGHCTVAEADIELVDGAHPVFCKARRVPPALKPAVDKCYDKLIDQGMIKPVSWSQWATPMVIVPKGKADVRLCGDFKVTLNPRIKVDQYPLPRPEDLFDAVEGGVKFSKLDLMNAFLQVPLSKRAKSLMVITTHRGLFQYEYLPFGIASAPAIFQRIMETLVAGIPGVIVYLDDITVTAPNDREHLKRLREVLRRLKKAGFKVKPEKCQFMLPEVQFLGHVVNSEGVKPIPEKIEAIKKMPAPQNIKELQAFIGMVGYYGKFIPRLSTLAQPLNELRQKDVEWSWGASQKKAFNEIKAMLSQASTLAHYDPTQEVVLATDASDYGLGAVLYHRYSNGMEKVVAYASRVMTPTERKYAQIEKEALGIVWGIDKFNHYIYGRKFTLLTDHQPLVKIFGSKSDLPVVAARRLHRWAVKLSMYQYDIEYVKTTEFGHADGLSRLPCPGDIPSKALVKEELVIKEVHEANLERIAVSRVELREATLNDEVLVKVLDLLRSGKWPAKIRDPDLAPYHSRRDDLTLIGDVICLQDRAVIPRSLQDRILKQLHRTHAGIVRMKSLARETVWFPEIDKKIEAMASRCKTCCETGPEKESVPLHPWSVPERAWQRIHIDFAGPFLQSMWLIVVDAKTKWPEVVRLSKATTATTVKALKRIFATHGFAELIVSDNGTPFTLEEWKNFLRENAIRHTLAPPYHPKSNGLAERFVRTFKEAMTKMAPKPSEIDDAVIDFLLLYRATPHPATGKAPAEMMLGRQVRTPLAVVWNETSVDEVPETREAYRSRMKTNYDKNTRERRFKVNDAVYARNLREGAKWYPGVIQKTTGSSMYLVQTDKGLWSRHADQLKPRVPELTVETQTLVKKSSEAISKPVELEKVKDMVIRGEGITESNPEAEQDRNPMEAKDQSCVNLQGERDLNTQLADKLRCAMESTVLEDDISSLTPQRLQPGLISAVTPHRVEGVTRNEAQKRVTFATATPRRNHRSLPRKQTPSKPVSIIRKSARLQEKYASNPPPPYSLQEATRQRKAKLN